MRIDFNISQTELGKFRTACEAVIRNVGTGTKSAVTDAGVGIMAESMTQVPVDTGTLLNSAYLGVSRRDDVVGYKYGAVLGYGEPEGIAGQVGLGSIEWYMVPNNGINQKSGKQASTYAGRVHEDLDMPHPNGGKAKFLEDPVRNWAAGKFARTAMTYWKQAIETTKRYSYTHYNRRTRTRELRFSKYPSYINRFKFVQSGSGVQRGGKTVHKGESE